MGRAALSLKGTLLSLATVSFVCALSLSLAWMPQQSEAISSKDLNALAQKSCGKGKDNGAKTCRSNYIDGYKAGEKKSDKAKACPDSKYKKNCESGYEKGKSTKEAEARTAERKQKAKDACKNKPSSQKSSCEKGYLGSLQGKTRENVCKNLAGNKKTACEGAFAAAEGAADENGVTDGPSDVPVSDIDLDSLPDAEADKNKLDTMANIAFGIAGSLAMLFVVIGGVRYIMSQGDPQKVSQSKNTILYAVAGLVVTISAFAIVRFVLQRAV